MSTPQVKRRRMNEAAKTLNKPFKSPFRTPLKSTVAPEIETEHLNDPSTKRAVPSSESLETGSIIAPSDDQRLFTEQSARSPATDQARVADALPSHQSLSRPSRSFSKKDPTKPSLTREIMQLRNDIQILSQAQALATSTKDDDLVVLIDRWRVASRSAAEELFATTRDKVNRMGGVGAWKAREREGKERQRKWDEEEREAEREKAKEARGDGEMEADAYDRYADIADEYNGDVKDEENIKAADDDSFTMDMMLKTLNIDLQLIGYSKDAQRWEG